MTTSQYSVYWVKRIVAELQKKGSKYYNNTSHFDMKNY